MHASSLTHPGTHLKSKRLLSGPVAAAVVSIGSLLAGVAPAAGLRSPQQPPIVETTDPFAADAPPAQTQPAETGVGSAQAALAAARQRVSELQSQVDRDRSDLNALNQKLAQDDAALARQRDDAAKADQVLVLKRQAADSAQAALESAQADYDSAQKDATSTFEASEAFSKARAAADAARADVAAREEADFGQLAATGAYKRAQDAAASSARALQSLGATRPSTDSDVADATQTAAEAKARLAELQSRYLNEDAQLLATRGKARETAAAVQALRQAFSAQLPQLPAIASARSTLAARQAAFDTAAPDIQQAQATRDAGAAVVRQAAQAIDADSEKVAELQRELDALNGRLVQARAEVEQAQGALNTALAAADQARQQAALAEQQARQQAALAAAPPAAQPQPPSTSASESPFDNPPPPQPAPPQAPQVAIGQAPGPSPLGRVVPGQVSPVPYGNPITPITSEFAPPYGYSYPCNPPAVIYEPMTVDPAVCVDPSPYPYPYPYQYSYSYAPYVYFGGYAGGRYYASYRSYIPYRERELIVHGGYGNYSALGNRYGGSVFALRRAPQAGALAREPSRFGERAQSQHVTARGNAARRDEAGHAGARHERGK
jgi:chromosome segregation ATPase